MKNLTAKELLKEVKELQKLAAPGQIGVFVFSESTRTQPYSDRAPKFQYRIEERKGFNTIREGVEWAVRYLVTGENQQLFFNTSTGDQGKAVTVNSVYPNKKWIPGRSRNRNSGYGCFCQTPSLANHNWSAWYSTTFHIGFSFQGKALDEKYMKKVLNVLRTGRP